MQSFDPNRERPRDESEILVASVFGICHDFLIEPGEEGALRRRGEIAEKIGALTVAQRTKLLDLFETVSIVEASLSEGEVSDRNPDAAWLLNLLRS